MKPRTDEEIVEQTNELARSLIMIVGYVIGPDVEIWKNRNEPGNSRRRLAWDLACEAQQRLTATDPNDALANLGL
jgi:hypothetical protein